MTFWQGVSLLAKYGALYTSWYQLEECHRPIPEFVIHTVPIVPLSKDDPFKVFPPPRRGVGRNPRKRSAVGEELVPLGEEEDIREDMAQQFEELEDEVPVEFDEEHELENPLGVMMGELGGNLIDAMEPPEEEGHQELVEAAREQEPQAHPPPAAGVRMQWGPRGHGEATVEFPCGKITYWSSKGVFEAICRNPAHGKCVLTRSAKARRNTEQRGGRPLGFLAAWLLKAEQAADKTEHWSQEFMHSSLEDRVAGRTYIAVSDNGEDLLSKERAPVPNEPEEPLSLDGLV